MMTPNNPTMNMGPGSQGKTKVFSLVFNRTPVPIFDSPRPRRSSEFSDSSSPASGMHQGLAKYRQEGKMMQQKKPTASSHYSDWGDNFECDPTQLDFAFRSRDSIILSGKEYELCWCKSLVKHDDTVALAKCGHVMCENCFLNGCPVCPIKSGGRIARTVTTRRTLNVKQFVPYSKKVFPVNLDGLYFDLSVQYMIPINDRVM